MEYICVDLSIIYNIKRKIYNKDLDINYLVVGIREESYNFWEN